MKERALNRGLADDQPELIQRRLQAFQDFTVPIVEYYQYRGYLLNIDGELSPEAVTDKIIFQL